MVNVPLAATGYTLLRKANMNFPFENCIVATPHLSVSRIQELLQFPHALAWVMLDLRLLEDKIGDIRREQEITSCLSGVELDLLNRLSSGKRKREWLGGRFAAKYVAARLLENTEPRGKTTAWFSHNIAADEHGRPFILTSGKDASPLAMPDISISHSGSLAAAMAVHRGYCGIDIQVITPKVLKVSERFCTSSEEQLLQEYSPGEHENRTPLLTELWAAKEVLRKASNMDSLPGFMEMELIEIVPTGQETKSGPRCFVFSWKNSGTLAPHKCNVAVIRMENYVLAFTARDGSLGD